MISIRNTENLTGVTVRGDFEDLYNLVEAFHEITIDEDAKKYREYIGISTRLLGTCYDIRHAYMGDREIVLVDNNLSEEAMKWHETIAPKQNVHYQCNLLYPEMIFAMIAINELINVRIKIITKKKFLLANEYIHKNVIWDQTITILRDFQRAFSQCVRETIPPNSYSRWLGLVTDQYAHLYSITGQYIDLINIWYINMTKEKRLKNFMVMTKRIGDFESDKDHYEIERVVALAAKEYACAESDIEIKGIDYPEDIEW